MQRSAISVPLSVLVIVAVLVSGLAASAQADDFSGLW